MSNIALIIGILALYGLCKVIMFTLAVHHDNLKLREKLGEGAYNQLTGTK